MLMRTGVPRGSCQPGAQKKSQREKKVADQRPNKLVLLSAMIDLIYMTLNVT